MALKYNFLEGKVKCVVWEHIKCLSLHVGCYFLMEDNVFEVSSPLL